MKRNTLFYRHISLTAILKNVAKAAISKRAEQNEPTEFEILIPSPII